MENDDFCLFSSIYSICVISDQFDNLYNFSIILMIMVFFDLFDDFMTLFIIYDHSHDFYNYSIIHVIYDQYDQIPKILDIGT